MLVNGSARLPYLINAANRRRWVKKVLYPDLVEEEVVGAVREEGTRLLDIEPLVSAEDQAAVVAVW